MKTLSVLLAFLFASTSLYAVTPNTPSRWNDGTMEGWFAVDNDLRPYSSFSNPTNYAALSFSDRSVSVPGIAIVMADVNAANGNFVGDYTANGVMGISFKMFCPTHTPAVLRLYLHCPASGNYWYFNLTVGELGWTRFTIPLNYESGWVTAMGLPKETFEADIQNVDWCGIYVFQNGTDPQSYGFDDFVVMNPWYDEDSDGMNNLDEIYAGTDPYNSASVFRMILTAENVGGITITWPSRFDAYYDLWRTTNLIEGFVSPLATGIPGSLDTNFTSYTDGAGLDDRSYFYRVKIQ